MKNCSACSSNRTNIYIKIDHCYKYEIIIAITIIIITPIITLIIITIIITPIIIIIIIIITIVIIIIITNIITLTSTTSRYPLTSATYSIHYPHNYFSNLWGLIGISPSLLSIHSLNQSAWRCLECLLIDIQIQIKAVWWWWWWWWCWWWWCWWWWWWLIAITVNQFHHHKNH